MSACAAIIRSREDLKKELEDTERLLRDFLDVVRRPEEGRLGLFYRLRDMLITRRAYLFAMLDYLERGAGSRGTALYTDPEGALPQEGMPELFRLVLDEGRHGDVIQEVRLGDGRCEARWRPVRPIPQMDYFFENQWREYRQREAEGLS